MEGRLLYSDFRLCGSQQPNPCIVQGSAALKNSVKVNYFDFVLYCIAFPIFVGRMSGFWDQPICDQDFGGD